MMTEYIKLSEYDEDSDLMYRLKYVHGDIGNMQEIGLKLEAFEYDKNVESFNNYEDAADEAVNMILSLASKPKNIEKIKLVEDETENRRKVITSCLMAAIHIAIETRRGAGNLLVCSEEIANIIGKDANRFKIVTKDIGNKILIGYVGNASNDAGAMIRKYKDSYTPVMTEDVPKYFKLLEVEE